MSRENIIIIWINKLNNNSLNTNNLISNKDNISMALNNNMLSSNNSLLNINRIHHKHNNFREINKAKKNQRKNL